EGGEARGGGADEASGPAGGSGSSVRVLRVEHGFVVHHRRGTEFAGRGDDRCVRRGAYGGGRGKTTFTPTAPPPTPHATASSLQSETAQFGPGGPGAHGGGTQRT